MNGRVEQVTSSLRWDAVLGGLALQYHSVAVHVESPVAIAIYWASAPSAAARIGSPVATLIVPKASDAGEEGTFHVPGCLLHASPPGATHLLAVIGQRLSATVEDVRIGFATTADPTALSTALRTVIQEGMRSAGVPQATISRTAVSPSGQARAMFQNLVREPGPLARNVATQLAIYRAPGQAVIRVFERQTYGMNLSQARAREMAIRAAMTDEILAQGPASVSKHCANPALISVADLPLSTFNARNRAWFREVVSPRVRLLEENQVYHMELAR